VKFEIDKEVIQDMIALHGEDHVIYELTSAFRAALESEIEKFEQELKNGN